MDKFIGRMRFNVILKLCLILTVGIGVGCKKENESSVLTAGSLPVTVNSNCLVSFDFDSTHYLWIVPPDSNANNEFDNSDSPGGSPDTVTFGARIEPFIGSIMGLNVYKGTCIFQSYSDSSTFYNFFPHQHIPFATQNTDGIHLIYVDDNGIAWSTKYSGGNQSGSSFRIVDTKYTNHLGNKYIKVHALFNCKLYDTVGTSKDLKNGNAVFVFKGDY